MNANNSDTLPVGHRLEEIRPVWFLITGVLFMTLSHLTWNVDLLAWVSMVPFLLYLHFTRGWKSRMIFALFLVIAWSLIVLKIVTEPVPYFLIPLYSVPIALIHLPGYLMYDKVKSHKYSLLVFPAIMITLEWIQYTFTPFATWGGAANTQVDSPNIIQGISLFGMAGLSFLIYWSNTAITRLLITGKPGFLSGFAPVLSIALFALYGHLRLDISRSYGKETVKVAAVGTDSKIGGLPLPGFDSNVEDIRAIFNRTRKAADLGARLVVWNEAAFYLTPGTEKAWRDSISTLAMENGIGITASYVVPISQSPFSYENKLVLFGPGGEIRNEYLKHEPVPGEPSVKGTGEIISIRLFDTEIGGAICYDYDFPYLAKKNREAKAAIVSLPSSDWRGIDPLHTRMACFRAIEQGHSIIRSTRFGLSAAINPYGEIMAHMSSFDTNDKILISDLPTRRIKTVYSFIGDIFVFCNIGFLLYFFFRFIPERRKPGKISLQME